jgi:F0F1-type ATP synthase membrane subunit b/b'
MELDGFLEEKQRGIEKELQDARIRVKDLEASYALVKSYIAEYQSRANPDQDSE